MYEQKLNNLLRDAACKVPQGCLCEDSGVCAYCCFVLGRLETRNMNCTTVSDQTPEGIFPENLRFKIPIGARTQIDELKRLFRLGA